MKIFKWWHQWRARCLFNRLQILKMKQSLLTEAENETRDNYYTDKLHDVVIESIFVNTALGYHQDALKRYSEPKREQ